MRLFTEIDCTNNVELAKKAAKEFDISILLKGANSVTVSYTHLTLPTIYSV